MSPILLRGYATGHIIYVRILIIDKYKVVIYEMLSHIK